jgi:hypothetical protein
VKQLGSSFIYPRKTSVLKNPIVELYEEGKQRISHRLTLISLVLQHAGFKGGAEDSYNIILWISSIFPHAD